MTVNELRLILWELNILQTELAEYLKVHPRTVRRWCSDGKDAQPIPEAVSVILRFAAASGITIGEMAEVAGRWSPAD